MIGWIFLGLLVKNRFRLVWLINMFNRAQSNQVETVEKALAVC